MRPLTRPGLLLAIVVAVVALPTVASGAFSAPALPKPSPPTAPATRTRRARITGAGHHDAHDIQHGRRPDQFRVAIPNRAQLTQDMLLLLFVDSDANPQTGDPAELGADYVIEVFGGEAALSAGTGRTSRVAPAIRPRPR